MRGGLAGVRARVDRMASKLTAPVGCPECRGKDMTLRLLCVYGDEVPIPRESRCDACSRVTPYRFATVRYDANMKPADMD